MYCKNCGSPFQSDQDAVCLNCGTQRGLGVNYCPNCANPTQENDAVCLNCGAALSAYANPNPEAANPAIVNPAEAKSKIAAGLLGIFLGCFGVHNFYLGFTQKAIIQLALSVGGIVLGTCLIWTGIGGLLYFGQTAAAIWGLIEGIMILTGSINADAKGNPLKD